MKLGFVYVVHPCRLYCSPCYHFRSAKLSLHTEYDVTVSNDELPSSFHVQLLELRDQYLSLVAEIADHVSSSPADSAIFTPDAGGVCLVQHCDLWYRGLVIARESETWNVRFFLRFGSCGGAVASALCYVKRPSSDSWVVMV